MGKIENTFHACSVFLHTFVYIFTLHCCLASRSAKALTGNAYQSASSVFLVTTSTLHMSHTFPRHDSQLSRIGLKTCLFGVFSWERRPENLEKNPSFLGQLVDTLTPQSSTLTVICPPNWKPEIACHCLWCWAQVLCSLCTIVDSHTTFAELNATYM